MAHIHVAYQASASTGFATEAAGFSAIWSIYQLSAHYTLMQ